MPPGKLDSTVLLTLGLISAGCGEKDTDTGPCLEYADDTGDTGDTGPCLEYEADTTEPPAPDAAAPPTAPDAGGRADARARVLARGVLPDDVAGLLAREEK